MRYSNKNAFMLIEVFIAMLLTSLALQSLTPLLMRAAEQVRFAARYTDVAICLQNIQQLPKQAKTTGGFKLEAICTALPRGQLSQEGPNICYRWHEDAQKEFEQCITVVA